MSLEIKAAHLKLAFYLLAWHLKMPNLFYANADIVYCFFSRMDENATYAVIAQSKNPDAEPCYFGEIIIYTAENGFVIDDKSDPTEKAALKRFYQDTFLNVAAWYICPLFEANGRKWPYMPRSYVEAYIYETKDLKKNNPDKYHEYLNGVFALINETEAKWWLYPYENVLSQFGEKAQENILIFMGMFLKACEEQKAKKRGATKTNLSPEVIKFLESIKEIEELDNPPPT
ncbi:MAG: hypothetical protein WAP23_01710 [Candidatus Spechtbacterales bacterium]